MRVCTSVYCFLSDLSNVICLSALLKYLFLNLSLFISIILACLVFDIKMIYKVKKINSSMMVITYMLIRNFLRIINPNTCFCVHCQKKRFGLKSDTHEK